jgi:hypothetical protein
VITGPPSWTDCRIALILAAITFEVFSPTLFEG